MKLNNDDTYKFQITLTNKETGDKISGILDNKIESIRSYEDEKEKSNLFGF